MEIWVDIPSTNGCYQASSLGRIRRSSPSRGTRVGKVLSPRRHPQGYLHVVLCVGGEKLTRKVHRLVAEAFLGFFPDLEVCHNDGNFDHNAPENLRWDTHLSNMMDRIKHGTMLYGEAHQNARLSENDVFSIMADTRSNAAIGRDYGICGQYVGKIKSGKHWKHLQENYNGQVQAKATVTV